MSTTLNITLTLGGQANCTHSWGGLSVEQQAELSAYFDAMLKSLNDQLPPVEQRLTGELGVALSLETARDPDGAALRVEVHAWPGLTIEEAASLSTGFEAARKAVPSEFADLYCRK